MAIGDLYNANNVVTGQAAVFFAPQQTPLIDLAKFNTADPFDQTAWVGYTLNVGTITSFTITVARRGTLGTATSTSASQTVSGLTAAALQTAINAMATVGPGGVVVTGTTTTGPFFLVFDDALQDAVVTYTPTGGAGSSLVGPTWQTSGATEQGWQLGADKSTQAINIEEQSTPVDTTLTSQAITLQANLSEDISKTLALSLNATMARVAATATVGAYDDLTLQDVPIYYAVAAVMQNAEGKGRILYAPKWTQLGNISAAFRRASGQRLYGASFATVCQTNQIRVLNFTSDHT